ncbi:hypothetical protein CEXT_56481 [Caerostris extrusa]|uniref:Transmembrane protein n=1 Tax=Caerostris extrusa TaxID=172846 RepID=A0AAV4SJ84_CAEEX|nr:hypothetical protein CEXT_56481 [Caerostris extrusa]
MSLEHVDVVLRWKEFYFRRVLMKQSFRSDSTSGHKDKRTKRHLTPLYSCVFPLIFAALLGPLGRCFATNGGRSSVSRQRSLFKLLSKTNLYTLLACFFF